MKPAQSSARHALVVGLATWILAAGLPASAVIYGEDDRMEPHQALPEHTDWPVMASNVVLMMPGSVLDYTYPDDLGYPIESYGAALGLCLDERFYEQPSPGFCSGAFVGPDLILTAGHCIESTSYCQNTALVFDFAMGPGGVNPTLTIDDVFLCEEIVARPWVDGNQFAIVRLDREAPWHGPLVLRRGGLLEHDPDVAGVIAIGHPYGMPVKLMAGQSPVGGADLKQAEQTYFSANVDAFGGNSGSAVFSLNQSGEILFFEGILVRGNTDWVDNGTCLESNICPDDPGCPGWEEATRLATLADILPAGCGDGLCDPGEDDLSCPADCPQDLDFDLHPDVADNCPLLPNPQQENLDGDPLGDDCDCDPANPDVWSTPGEVRDLAVFHDAVIGWTELSWAPPVEPGTLLAAFDVLRSDVPFDFHGAALCLESDDLDLQAEDWAPVPPPGEVVFYVVRAKSPCPINGTGTAGWDSFDLERFARDCP